VRGGGREGREKGRGRYMWRMGKGRRGGRGKRGGREREEGEAMTKRGGENRRQWNFPQEEGRGRRRGERDGRENRGEGEGRRLLYRYCVCAYSLLTLCITLQVDP
jgi:hypothetical protein